MLAFFIKEVIGMNKKYLSIFTAIVLCIIFIGMVYYLEQNSIANPPDITVKIEDQLINTEVGLNEWNGAVYDREDVFKTIIKQNNQIPYVQLGEMVQIEFKENNPDKITVTDYILTKEGNLKYSDKAKEIIALEKEDGAYRFQLKSNLASFLSSNSEDYKKGNTIRGFRILCNWGKNECEYGFILRTDGSTTQVDNEEMLQEDVEVFHTILPEGNNLATRIIPPKDYVRTEEDNNSFMAFMRKLPLKRDGSPVLLYNGDEKNNQDVHIAVFDIDIGEKDLQQCADSIIRIYAEYYWSNEEYDKIAFHLTNNFLMEYIKWRDGNRLKVNGNQTSWVKTAAYDDSYETFRKFLDTVFIYAGTLSLDRESEKIGLENIQAGDMFIKGGSPGHCVLVVDAAVKENGDRAYLLAQGFMPAQEFHVLKNPLHEEDPWYYDNEIVYPLKTPQWTFEEGSLKRWME
ncbi:uncharacterized protein DUF4846 [Mobilisporobacter senegalensis]|uniref:Uncharacterized protein DUF4846 n=2 Tax=Mobilisporobacter senegalensis TaxID=1329262 RepID=A0A3N1X6B0_9FIRM|nr:uncharacterized protein DUF4846 [Mobilisporobacter senegalensis]